jgi:hypothetical protein
MFIGKLSPLVRNYSYPIAFEISDENGVLITEEVLALSTWAFVFRRTSCRTELARVTGEIAAPGVVQGQFSASQTNDLPAEQIRLTLESDSDGDVQRIADVSIYAED